MRPLAWLWITAAALGCGGGHDPLADAGYQPIDTGLPRPDAGRRGTAGTLEPCTGDLSCADAPGVECLTNVAGGACTRRCDLDTECGPGGTCVAHICLWSCTSGTGDCVPHAGACTADGDGREYCTPICYPAGREPPGYPPCGTGLVCDPYVGACVTTPTTGLDDGAPCRDGVECRGGGCYLETSYVTGASTGFLDGMCVSYGIIPGPEEYVDGRPIPQGSCPDGSAPMPIYGDYQGDLTVCYPTCLGDADCRSGYACTHLEGTPPRFMTGLCLPIDCAGAPCPAGTTCGADPDPTLGHVVCGRVP